MIKLNDLLREIGEGSSGIYRWRHYKGRVSANKRMEIIYQFKTELYNYNVRFSGPTTIYPREIPADAILMDVRFWPIGEGIGAITNEGKPLKIVNTVVNIAYNLYKQHDALIDGFVFGGISKDDEEYEFGGDYSNQRNRLYKTFVKSQFENRVKIWDQVGHVTVVPIKNYKKLLKR